MRFAPSLPARSVRLPACALLLLLLSGCNWLSGRSANQVGQVYYRFGNYTAAANEFHRASIDDPRNADYQYNLAAARKKQGLIAESENSYRRALAINPGHQPSYHGLAAIMKQQGRTPEAIALMQSWVGSEPYRTAPYVELAWLQRESGDLAGATQTLNARCRCSRTIPRSWLIWDRSIRTPVNPPLRWRCTSDRCTETGISPKFIPVWPRCNRGVRFRRRDLPTATGRRRTIPPPRPPSLSFRRPPPVRWPRMPTRPTSPTRRRPAAERHRKPEPPPMEQHGNANPAISGISEDSWDVAAICRAHERIRPHIHRTPVMTCRALDEASGARLFFKCENLQKAGAFKSRGACNAVFSLNDAEAALGVVTHSSGNHAAALARAAALRGIPAHIVMPSNAPAVKVAAVKHYGGVITFCEPTLTARESTAETVLRETGGTMIHPYNDHRIIAGQGTAAVEFLDDVPDLDFIMTPVGGGGLLAGTAIAAKSLSPRITVVAGEPLLADDAFRSLRDGSIISVGQTPTIADGLKTSLGDKTFAVIRRLVEAIYLASETGIVRALELTLTRAKTVIEPSSAVPLAAILESPAPFAGKRVGIILSGGNLDLTQLPQLLALKS